MAVLTESELRRILMDRTVPAWTIPAGTVATPAALDFLKERGITPVFEVPGQGVKDASFKSLPPGSFVGPDGAVYDHKPEGLTHLTGRRLVAKNHPIIRFRGRLDSLCARLISAQLIGVQLNRDDYVQDLEEILNFVRILLPCELRNEKVPEMRLCSWEAQEIKERSHNPLTYFGHRHMKSTWKMGPLSVALNELRTMVRETELAAAEAFQDKNGLTEREDIIKALNRLSSLFYVLMFKYLPEGFVPEPSGI
ncbi:MAG: cobalamin adenosyltransferase [Deltaproteobacteria bacterium]|jgi:ethanolamine utilization cobalamin adenosyltransferase|nr:cobalamin adenosyltransferase [Deltaproteobacteria bacterium]